MTWIFQIGSLLALHLQGTVSKSNPNKKYCCANLYTKEEDSREPAMGFEFVSSNIVDGITF